MDIDRIVIIIRTSLLLLVLVEDRNRKSVRLMHTESISMKPVDLDQNVLTQGGRNYETKSNMKKWIV